MVRLSDTAIEIINELHTERLDYSSEYIPLIDAANSLAAYEDTGLEPEEIADFMKRWEQTVEIGGMLKKYCIDHIRDLLHAEQDGRLVVLPCKVGGAVYWLHNGVITDCRLHSVRKNSTGLFIYLKSKVVHGAFQVDTCLGKTVFLTREEAEAALAGKGGEG